MKRNLFTLFYDIARKIKSLPQTNTSSSEPNKYSLVNNRTIKSQRHLTFPDVYIALDVETPNERNDRISQIGLFLVENGKVIENHSTLINPETTFSVINRNITGIDSSMVIDAPKFNEYWDSVRVLFENYIIIAHNASFDLTVLCKTLDYYQLEIPTLKYVCTYVEAQNRFTEIDKYSLSSLSQYFGIELLNAHNAESDVTACYQIFEKMKGYKYQFTPACYKINYNRAKLQKRPMEDVNLNLDIIPLPYTDSFNYIFKDKRFVLTGSFTQVSKKIVSEYITNNGGTISSSVSGKTDFLIVGSEAEPAWKHKGYGTKIEKALSLLNGDSPKIQIIKESLISDYIKSKI